MPLSRARAMIAGMSVGHPPRWTGMIALVRGVSTGAMVAAVMLPLFGSTSAKTGVAPTSRTQKADATNVRRSEEHTSELQSRQYLVCRLLLEKKNERRRQQSPQVFVLSFNVLLRPTLPNLTLMLLCWSATHSVRVSFRLTILLPISTAAVSSS